MYEYDEECLKTFLKNQSQLFDEPVAESIEEAEAFLEDCMAAVVDNIDEVLPGRRRLGCRRNVIRRAGGSLRSICTSRRKISDRGRISMKKEGKIRSHSI